MSYHTWGFPWRLWNQHGLLVLGCEVAGRGMTSIGRLTPTSQRCLVRPFRLYRQVLLYHLGAQLILFPRRHHRSFGHHDITVGQPGGKMQALLD